MNNFDRALIYMRTTSNHVMPSFIDMLKFRKMTEQEKEDIDYVFVFIGNKVAYNAEKLESMSKGDIYKDAKEFREAYYNIIHSINRSGRFNRLSNFYSDLMDQYYSAVNSDKTFFIHERTYFLTKDIEKQIEDYETYIANNIFAVKYLTGDSTFDILSNTSYVSFETGITNILMQQRKDVEQTYSVCDNRFVYKGVYLPGLVRDDDDKYVLIYTENNMPINQNINFPLINSMGYYGFLYINNNIYDIQSGKMLSRKEKRDIILNDEYDIVLVISNNEKKYNFRFNDIYMKWKFDVENGIWQLDEVEYGSNNIW